MSIVVIGAMSDTHGHLPDVPSHLDVLLHAGDICPDWNLNSAWRQGQWLDSMFRQWMEDEVKVPLVTTWGNHDWVGMGNIQPVLPWHLLVDREVSMKGIRVYGTPWSKRFSNWAYMDSETGLDDRFSRIPTGLDVLLVHGPPYGHVDDGTDAGQPLGSQALLKHIRRAKPALVVCGHIHEAKGDSILEHDDGSITRIYNVSYLDLSYQPYAGPAVHTVIYDTDTRREV